MPGGGSNFLKVPRSEWVAENEHAFAFRDRYPVSPGHTLVVSRRVIENWFSATVDEQLAILELVERVKRDVDRQLHPDGYNVGFNAGEAAGQTVMHLHVHVIPRYRGDMDDPRGGVRYVIPTKGNYLRTVKPLSVGGDDPFARHVLPLLDRATEIAIVAAFVRDSGLDRIEDAVHLATARGAHVRILTGDYLEITQASALERLLDWQCANAIPGDDEEESAGRLEARVVEVDALPWRTRSFHPKSWRFQAPTFGVAFVGSSNLSRAALDTGVEWNLRVDRDQDARAYAEICTAFDSLWARARLLDAAWIEAYAERARRTVMPLPLGEIEAEPLERLPDLHDVQREALATLRDAREQGRRRALVVLATGLGKTLLAVSDYAQLRDETGARPRLLFLAHRRELLRQAAATYRRKLHELSEHARVGWFIGDDDDLTADLVFASVAKLARSAHLERLRQQRFDYVVVDEVHHAAARSYRDILDALEPGFLLGLTATPDRADSADILGLFDDFVAYRADIARGIELGRLVPFRYFGVKDDIDYQNIPWRNKRFDLEALARAAQTEARMQTLWRAWREHPAERTLVFCCSIAHARYVRSWLERQGLRVAAVFSGDDSDDRESVLAELERGERDAVCSVDIFNEGVDVPSIDRVVMLRPTESSVVFLQQLGRGLRTSTTDKEALTVIDFAGNHRIFLERVRALLSIAGATAAANLRAFLESTEPEELPAGCSVDLELEAKQMLARLFRVSGADEVERVYRELKLERGQRPTAGELQRMGYVVSRIRERHGSWFDFVRSEGDLTEDEVRALDGAGAFLREVEITEMTKCFKMVTLEALLEAGALTTGTDLQSLAARSHRILQRSPELYADIAETERIEVLDASTDKRWLAYWRRNPIHAWTSDKPDRRTWFRIDGDRFLLGLAIPSVLTQALSDLTRELVDYRLAQYRARRRREYASPEGFLCKLTWNQRDPILKLPSRKSVLLPRGETDVRLQDGSVWQFRFSKEFCNVARPAGTQVNQLPDLLRRWFGPRAGQPGTSFEVRFHASPDGLWLEPVQATVTELAPRRQVIAYPELRVAAGHAHSPIDMVDPDFIAMLPIAAEDPELFAVRVSGTSMDGGKHPMRDGDWAVMRLARSASASSLAGRVILVQVPSTGGGHDYQIKRLTRSGSRWSLTSDNPEGPTIEPTEDMVPIARLEHVIRPEDLAPPVGTLLDSTELPTHFGFDATPHTARHGGHLFVFIDQNGILESTDRIRTPSVTGRPGETAYVLAQRPDSTWRYLGVAHRTGTTTWRIPDVDYGTWRTWGSRRDVSRAAPEGALSRAQLAADALLALQEAHRRLEQPNDRRARILGRAQRGGLRIDGGKGGFAERTVSLTDIAWAIVADDDVRDNGGLLDEERVNRLRYLEGTPKASTRWIDTGWAIAAWTAAKPLLRNPIATPSLLLRVHRDDGTPLSATFRLERIGDTQTLIIESRGGTRGSTAERNTDYNEGLELLLQRLARSSYRIADALVESRETARLSDEDRRLDLGAPYPMAIDDPQALRRKMSAAQARVGRARGARGSGNQTKRLRLYLDETTPIPRNRDLARALEHAI